MRSSFTIIATLFIAFVLTVVPMPDWASWMRPAWLLMVLMFWSINTPDRVGVGVAFLVGLILDLMNGGLVGEHAMTFTAMIYLTSKFHLRLRMYTFLQQGASVFLFVLAYELIRYCIQGFIGELPMNPLYWLSSVTSVLFWPWIFALLRDCQRWFERA